MRRTLKSRFLLSTIMGGVVATTGMTAMAQDAVEDEIITTGTRISNPNLVQSSQILVIGSEEADIRNVTNVEALIREIPGVVPNIGPAVNNGSGGAATLDLRGIGSNRNLVLVDGRRIVPFGLGNVTDTNNIPLAIIERADVVTGGASSVYGADAVSGVLNFVTKRDFEGAELTTSYGGTERGDGETLRIEALIGANTSDGRGNVTFSAGYQESNPVLQGNRGFSEFVIDSTDGSRGGSINSAPFVLRGTGSGENAISNDQFNPDTGLLEDGFTRFNFAPLNLLNSPVQRFNIYSSANYEITPDIEVFGQGFFTRTAVATRLAPSAVFGNTVEIPLSNPFLTDGVRDQLCVANGISAADCVAADGITDPTAAGFQSVDAAISRRFVEAGGRQNNFDTDQFQIVGGLRGDLNGWDWEVSGQYGESTQIDTSASFGLLERVEQALFAVDESTCVDPSNGCVPINLFGDLGTISQESLAFIDAPATTTTTVDLLVLQANMTGDLEQFKSPWADQAVGVALGGEYREINVNESGDFLASQQGALLGAGAPDPAISGGFDVLEGYVEVIAPIVTDRDLIHSLTLEAGARISDYSTTGTSATYKIGGSWEPTEDLRFRTVYQRAVRSPNIGELFDPPVTGLGNLAVDPCAGAAPTTNAQLEALCIAQGAPSGQIGFISNPAASQVSIVIGGNPDLDVEVAQTFTAGVVVQPSSVPNLTVSLDYFNINITDAISNPAEDDVISGCFGAGNAGLTFNETCQTITRNALTGSLNLAGSDIGGIELPLSNLGELNTSGFDLGLAYSYDLEEYGSLDYGFNGTYTIENLFQASPTAINRECAGFYSPNCGNVQSELQFNQRVTWTKDIYALSLRHRYLSGTEIEPILQGDFLPEFEEIRAYHYFDSTLVVDVTEWAEFSFTVNNILDTDPPSLGSDVGTTSFNNGNTFPTVYDPLGRSYTAAIRLRF